VVGEVAQLHDAMAWFERRPLFGKRIVVTRARAQASELVRTLRAMGADVFEFPTIEIVPAETDDDFGPVEDYDWIVFTSVNGVDMLFDRLEDQGLDARDLHGVKLCVIGSATADAVRKRFLRIDAMPEKYVAEDLLAELLRHETDLRGKRFLLPRADIARSFLPRELRDRGAEVTELIAYRTAAPKSSAALIDALLKFDPGLVTFTSSSTARNLREMIGEERLESLKERAAFAAIGPITARTARELGMAPAVEAEEHSIPGLVQAIVEWAAKQ
jgi:uroporphyrinogen III methyltransferase/synthase